MCLYPAYFLCQNTFHSCAAQLSLTIEHIIHFYIEILYTCVTVSVLLPRCVYHRWNDTANREIFLRERLETAIYEKKFVPLVC